ncbi:UDP-glycosyltransferase UGT5-like [Athalia rosae]|uniref:UDP-glycosyltransferase UGT5-like n=1 Tax=Athalia rosae TaxID=37344 RepID=UPI00203475E4|nr:UDP-glycosyltransferase UGT5-like [Athalia rosae]XP_048513494.1 UDP-glycosyltransferase UGT5-like [Athalia rosae]
MILRLLILLGVVNVRDISVTCSGQRFKILALLPHYGKSHWTVFEPVLEELARRGNNVTVLGHFPREIPMDNYHDITMHESVNRTVNSKDIDAFSSRSYVSLMMDFVRDGDESVCRKGLRHPNVQKLIKSDEKFDILITEIFNTDCFLGFVHKTQLPFVGLRAAPPSPWTNERIANPDNPSYVPNSLAGKSTRMNFFDRLENFSLTLWYKIFYRYHDGICTEIAREHFGEEMPPLEEIASRVSVILSNSHFAHCFARPLVPGVKEIGGVHIPPNKPLPQDLESWIAGAEHGVVYFSLGSSLRTESLSVIKRKAFFDAFAELPQRVLMKWEGNETKGVPTNVKTVQWSPQFDVISHPNVRVFISHGGMLGTTEAVWAGKPMLVIPVFGDQPTNAALLEEKGFAVVLGYSEITKETLSAALGKVLHDPSYRTTAKKMSEVIRDRLVSPLDEAVYWIEYVARHRGAPWLKTPAHGMPLYKYLLLDVIGFVIAVSLLSILATCLIARRLYVKIMRKTVVAKTINRDVRMKSKRT